MTTTHTHDRPDTHDMIVAHRVFRREATLLPRLVAAVADGDLARAAVLTDHLHAYQFGLKGHHTAEDEVLWPLLLARVDLEADVVLRMQDQHERIAANLDLVSGLAAAWRSRAAARGRDALVAALTEHRTLLLEHLADEETYLLPLAEQYLSVAEWGRLGEHFAASTRRVRAGLG